MAVDNLTAVEFTFPKRCYSEKWRSEKLHSEKSEAPNLGLPPTVTKLIPTNLSHLNFISDWFNFSPSQNRFWKALFSAMALFGSSAFGTSNMPFGSNNSASSNFGTTPNPMKVKSKYLSRLMFHLNKLLRVKKPYCKAT